MELQNLNNIVTIFILTGLLFIFIVFIKWVSGDFSPISIDKIDEKEINVYNEKGDVISKNLLVTYKYTYRDDKVKYKTKKHHIN